MEYLQNGFNLELSSGAFPLSTDSIALSHFLRLPRKASVLDLGSGCGTLGLLLCARDPLCSVTGVEIDPEAHDTALKNIRANGVESRLRSICADLRTVSLPGSFDICISNPPYFAAGPASKTHPTARREDFCSLEDLFTTAARQLKFGGDFYLVHKPERLAEICGLGAKYKLEAKRLCLLRHRSNGPISLILMQLRKGAHPGLEIREESLYQPDGAPTPYYKTLYNE